MSNRALEFFDKSEESYKEAKKLLKENKYSKVIDKSHDVVEYSLKCLLSSYGIKYPPNHNLLEFIPKIIDKIPKENPNFYFYSEVILPPFIVIHKILISIRNMARYEYKDISSDKLFNEGIAKSILLMLDSNYPSLKGWMVDNIYK